MKKQEGPHQWAIDADGSLFEYDFDNPDHVNVGKPIEESVKRVKDALARGEQVWVFTARISPSDDSFEQCVQASQSFVTVAKAVKEAIGQDLPITNIKNRRWKEMLDDRGVELIPNLGITLRQLIEATQNDSSKEDGQELGKKGPTNVR